MRPIKKCRFCDADIKSSVEGVWKDAQLLVSICPKNVFGHRPSNALTRQKSRAKKNV